MRILIVKLSSLGDVIHTLPALSSLKGKFPHARITWVVEEEASELLTDHPLVDEVLVLRKKQWLAGLKDCRTWHQTFLEVTGFLKDFRCCSYDLVFDFQGLLKSGVLVGASRGERKVGFYPGREGSDIFLNEKVAYPKMSRLHAVDRYLHLIESTGCSSRSPQFLIPIRQVHRDAVWEFLDERRLAREHPLILLHPGSRWKSKLWEEDKWAALGDLLANEHGARVIFTGGEKDAPLITRITERMKIPGTNTAGRWGLKELAFLQMQADVVVIPDSGPMHLAAAVGTPVVALFGPTDPGLTGPYRSNCSGRFHTVISAAIECRPCFKRTCSSRRCMTNITMEEVWEKTTAYLSTSDSHGLKALSV